MENEDMDLFYHALNYRTAATENAEACWQELQACVARIVSAEREACAAMCDRQAQLQSDTGADDCCISEAKRCARDIRGRLTTKQPIRVSILDIER